MNSPSAYALLAFAALGLACSSGRDKLQTELGQLRRELSQVRAQSLALQDRLDALEERGPGPASASTPAQEDRPTLEVVRLEPKDGEEQEPSPAPVAAAEAAEEAEPRPVIRSGYRGVELDESRRAK